MRRAEPLFAPDAGGGAPAGQSAPSGAAASSPLAAGAGRDTPTGFGQGSQPGSGEPPDWKAPDFLPEALRDADVAKTFDKVSQDWKRLRDTVAAIPPAPKSVDEYQFKPSEKVAPFVGDLAKDPAFALMRQAALEAGIPAAQFSKVVGGFYEGLVEKGMAPQPYNEDRERVSLLGKQAETMTEAQRIEAVKPILTPLLHQLEGLARTNAFDPDPAANKAAAAAVMGLLDTADGVRALKGILSLVKSDPGLQPGGAPQVGSVSAADLRKRMGDPRNTPGDFRFDPAFYNETQELYRRHYA